MREVKSWVSDDENCEADACEPRETLLVDGERTLVLLFCGEDEAAAGVKAFALPRTRPPPSVLGGMV